MFKWLKNIFMILFPKPGKKKKNKVKFDRKKVIKMFENMGITSCEVNLPCCEKYGETPAHRHKRRWYLKWYKSYARSIQYS